MIDIDNIQLSCTQVNEIIGTSITKDQLELYLSNEGINSKRIPVKVLYKIHPVSKDKIAEILKAIETGVTKKNILGDRDCILGGKITGWANIPALFMSHELRSEIDHELITKRALLLKNKLIKLRNGKYYELHHDVNTKNKRQYDGASLFDGL